MELEEIKAAVHWLVVNCNESPFLSSVREDAAEKAKVVLDHCAALTTENARLRLEYQLTRSQLDRLLSEVLDRQAPGAPTQEQRVIRPRQAGGEG